MKLNPVLIALALTAGGARADVSPWTGRARPEIFATFKYPYKVAAEIEVSRRMMTRLAKDLDLSQLERGELAVDLAPFAETYLNRISLENLRRRQPELVAQLTRGLQLDRSVSQQILAHAENAQAKIMEHFRRGLVANGAAPSSPVPKVGSNGLIGSGGGALHERIVAEVDPTRAKLLAQFDATSPVPKVSLPGFKAFGFGAPSILIDKPQILAADGSAQMSTAEITRVVESDWRRLHERWDELDPAVKTAAMRFTDLADDKKAEIVVRLTRHQKDTSAAAEGPTLDVTTNGAPYLRPFVAERDGAYSKLEDGQVVEFFDDPEGRNTEEFRHRAPVTSALTYLDQLRDFTQAAGNFEWIREPRKVSRRDSAYHWNFSVEGRREHLGPLLRAWQNLIVIKQLEANIINVVGTYGFSVDDDAKGMVRLKGRNFVEVRDHFADPEFELALFMSAVELRNRDGIRLIYDHLPAVTPAMLRVIRNSVEVRQGVPVPVGEDAFLHFAFGSPRLPVEVTREMFADRSPLVEAEQFFTHSLRDPMVLHDPRRVMTYLGPEGAAALRQLIADHRAHMYVPYAVARAHHRYLRVAREDAWVAKGYRALTAAVLGWRKMRTAVTDRFARTAERIDAACEDLLLTITMRRQGRP